MAKKQDSFYFDNFVLCAEESCRAAKMLKETLGDFREELLEERLEQIDKEMAANATNAGKLMELSDEQQEIQQKLDEKMDRWVYLNDLAEQIENQKE